MYNPYYYQPQQTQYQPQAQYQQPVQQQQSGIIPVSSEDEALKYPIAPGNSIMFMIENLPLIIEKSIG
jgi:hypothetical protein